MRARLKLGQLSAWLRSACALFKLQVRMSRFVKRSDNEPLMRLERPTIASSQSTAHIINSCFNEVLSKRQQMDSGAINNMAVSRRGDPDLYHDSFVKEAKEVRQ